MKVSVHSDLCSFVKLVVFIDLPCNPLIVSVVNRGENGNVALDRGHFLTAKQISFNGILVFMLSCVGFGYVAL